MATLEIHHAKYTTLPALLPAPHTIDVTVEDIAADTGDQITADHLPFHAISYDENRHELDLTVKSRSRGEPQRSHRIVAPTGMWLEIRDGVVHSLAVESDGHRTIMTFHPRPALAANHDPKAELRRARDVEPGHVDFFG